MTWSGYPKRGGQVAWENEALDTLPAGHSSSGRIGGHCLTLPFMLVGERPGTVTRGVRDRRDKRDGPNGEGLVDP